MNQATPVRQAPAPRPRRETLKLGSKPSAARGLAPAAAPAASPPASIGIIVSPSVPLLFPLGRLRRATENVRHTRVDEDCEQLADDIQEHGLLQSLIGYMDGPYVEIVGGGRRLKALRIVKARGHIDDDFTVPVLIRDQDEAEELSIAEGIQQRTLSPVDEFLGFRRLMAKGDTSPADLAKRFGWTERLVKQRLRLAELARPVLDALADRQITLDAAMAYASQEDTALQVEVFEHQAKRGHTAHKPDAVRHALRMKGIDTADRLYRFVGAVAYEREGGRYGDDLFTDMGKDRQLAQPFLLETLANDHVDFQAMRLIEELKQDDAWAPTIAGAVKVPDLRLHGYGTSQKMRPPLGFVLIERAEPDKLWRTIRNNGLPAHVVVGIDEHGKLIADRRYAFVPVGQKAAIEKPSLVDKAEDTDRAAIATREREIIRWSRRLAVPPSAGTPFEGRLLWPDAYHDYQAPTTIDGRSGFLTAAMIFVTDDEIAASRKAAAIEVDRRLAATAAEGDRA